MNMHTLFGSVSSIDLIHRQGGTRPMATSTAKADGCLTTASLIGVGRRDGKTTDRSEGRQEDGHGSSPSSACGTIAAFLAQNNCCGNSVSPPPYAAIVAANCPELVVQLEAAE